MTRELVSIDISHVPELLRLVEEVASSGTPRLLRREDEAVAIIMPVTSVTEEQSVAREKTAADHEAFLASAGTWADVDADALVEHIYESRNIADRPPIEL